MVTAKTIPLKTICSQLKVDPRSARRKLRHAGVKGHTARDRWTFKMGSDSLKHAREVLRA